MRSVGSEKLLTVAKLIAMMSLIPDACWWPILIFTKTSTETK